MYCQLLRRSVLHFHELLQKFGTEFQLSDWSVMVEQIDLHDQQVCFADFVEIFRLAFFFMLPLPNRFIRVCVPANFADVFSFFLPLATSEISGAEISNKSLPICFATGTIYLDKFEIAVLPKTCASTPNPRPRCRPTSLKNGISTCFEATTLYGLFG